MRRIVIALAVALALVADASPVDGSGAVPVLVVEGRGFGHGVGMAQDGAFWMGRAGAATNQILGQFYPGSKLARATGSVRVTVLPGDPKVSTIALGFPNGGEIRDALDGEQSSGFPVRVPPRGQVEVTWDGASYRVEGSDAPSTDRPLWAVPTGAGTISVPARGRQYHGVVQATAQGGTPLRLVNQLDVEQYLKGMGEVRDPSWPPASLRAQAIAARTYALRAMTNNGELCDDQRCQVYLGAQAEYQAMNRAVNETKTQVIVHNKRLASTVYSANGGGVEASREEGFGDTGVSDTAYPYLRPAPYLTRDPLPWSNTLTMNEVGSRLGYRGATTAQVTQTGPSGRALTVTLDGPAGPKQIQGIAFARALGLRSTLFTLTTNVTTDAPPPPPTQTESPAIQSPPDAPQEAATPAAVAESAPAGGWPVGRGPQRRQPLGRGPEGQDPPVRAIEAFALAALATVTASALRLRLRRR